jgi:hypothetical protein
MRASLAKMRQENKSAFLMKSAGEFTCRDYLEAIVREGELNERTVEFIKFWSYKERETYLCFNEFVGLFKSEEEWNFITHGENDGEEEGTADSPEMGKV